MQIKFLTMYHNFKDPEASKINAQDELLWQWKRSLQLADINFIKKATIEFNDYEFYEYPDQERAKKEINRAYLTKYQTRGEDQIEYWWAGEQYNDLDSLYRALATQKRFMELVITVEEN